jgi:hypothetical protein
MMRTQFILGVACTALLAWSAIPADALAHGFAGKRFFPATPTTEDPFVADELSLPTVTQRRLAASDEGPATRLTTTSAEFAKSITSNFGIGLEASYLRFANEDGTTQNGFDNLGASAKYQFYKSDANESVASVGLDWDIGGSGARSVGAERFSTLTPAVFFGKGFGNLSEGLRYLRPLAVTGSAGIAFPGRHSTTTVSEDGDTEVEQHPDALKLGFAVEYSLPYLQSAVKDVGLPAPFNRMIPLVEFDLEKPINRGASGFTGTVNPGILWAGRSMQFSVEAILPVNSRTGGGKGVLLQVHFFLDDLFPRSVGKPLL